MPDGTSSVLREIWLALREVLDPSTRSGGAVLGSFVMAGLLKGETFGRRVFYILASIPTAYYSSLALSHYFPSTSPGVAGVFGFVSGVFALRLLQRVFLAAEHLDGDTLLGRILDRVIGPSRTGGGQP